MFVAPGMGERAIAAPLAERQADVPGLADE
jgi:hypothetical protein